MSVRRTARTCLKPWPERVADRILLKRQRSVFVRHRKLTWPRSFGVDNVRARMMHPESPLRAKRVPHPELVFI